jgi:hypothetical protein
MTWRHYYVSRHNHDCPDWWLAHDNIDDHFLDLGSWCADHPILVDLGVGLPVASTSDASEVTESSAILNGSVTDDGGEACEYRFRYKRLGGSYTETSWTQRNPDLYDTVLNGDIGTSGVAADNSYHVVTSLFLASSGR